MIKKKKKKKKKTSFTRTPRKWCLFRGNKGPYWPEDEKRWQGPVRARAIFLQDCTVKQFRLQKCILGGFFCKKKMFVYAFVECKSANEFLYSKSSFFFTFFYFFFFWRHFSSNKALFPKIETHPRKCSQLWTKITRSWWQNDVLNLGCQHSGPMRDLQTQNFKSRLQSKISRFQLFAPKCHMPGLCWVGLVVFFGWI